MIACAVSVVVFSLVMTECSGVITDSELRSFSEQLFEADRQYRVFRHLEIDKGGRVPRGVSNVDHAPDPLIAALNASQFLNQTTYRALVNFYNNYVADVSQLEHHTRREHDEQVFFIDSIMRTRPMQLVKEILSEKGLMPSDMNDFKRELKRLWFDIYSRNRGLMTSSGFEHVLLGEIKRGEVSGFHNWLYFYYLELNGDVNYLGYKKYLVIGNREAAAIKFTFKWNSHLKPVSSMLVGVSPQFDIALYTLCFHARPNTRCPISLSGRQLDVRTHVHHSQGQRLIGSAYVDI